MSSLFRTHRTSLTDDELILLDVLFTWRISFVHLRRVNFAVQFNRASHDLDDAQLRETLKRFCQEGILITEPPDAHLGMKDYGEWFEITRRGGELWESERAPVWERFVSGRYSSLSNGKEMISFCGPSARICEDFLRAYWDYGVWKWRLRRVRLFQITNHELLPWKSFPTLYVAVGAPGAAVPIEEGLRRAWSLVESRRSAWSNVEELQKFVGQKPAS